MSRTLTLCRSGVSVAAALVLLSACGGSDNTTSASSGSAETSSSASGSGADEAGSEFCTKAASIEERVSATLQNSQDPAALPQALQEAAAEVRAIEPPAEIASDWNAVADGMEQIAAAVATIDFNDPKALAAFEQQAGQLQSKLTSASTNVENYVRDHCGIDIGSSESASPTS
jgi:hypothetical protein